MELKAENKYTITEELYREGMNRIMENEYMPAAKKLLIALGVIWVILAYVTLRFGGGLLLVIIEFAAAVFAGFWMMAVSPKKRVTSAWAATRRAADGLDRHAMFYEDRMEVEPGDLIVNYENVQKTLETEHLLILISDEGVGVMLVRDAYTLGGQETVMALLEEWKR